MLLHSTHLGIVNELKEEIRSYGRTQERLNSDMEHLKRDHKVEIDRLLNQIDRLKETQQFELEKAKFQKAKEMEKALMESDITRVKAQTALETYQKMDSKDDREHMRKMLDKAITSLGQRIVVKE
jgi:hypothetical protein